jgi:hypothetical protein
MVPRLLSDMPMTVAVLPLEVSNGPESHRTSWALARDGRQWRQNESEAE